MQCEPELSLHSANMRSALNARYAAPNVGRRKFELHLTTDWSSKHPSTAKRVEDGSTFDFNSSLRRLWPLATFKYKKASIKLLLLSLSDFRISTTCLMIAFAFRSALANASIKHTMTPTRLRSNNALVSCCNAVPTNLIESTSLNRRNNDCSTKLPFSLKASSRISFALRKCFTTEHAFFIASPNSKIVCNKRDVESSNIIS
mmetsp:Transcript_2640/g.5009  ORF Transcript_2640/g.5009 Transcript_2640/m.5009 type:complete len:202 (+) Transcript_2640:576-1181(+)